MIIVLSTASFEETTNEIVSWLKVFGANYLRINGEDLLNNDFKVVLKKNCEYIQNNSIENLKMLFDAKKLIIFNRRWYNYISMKSNLLDMSAYSTSVSSILSFNNR